MVTCNSLDRNGENDAAAFSIIGDSFPKEKRGLPIAVYSMALILGSGLANLIAFVILPWARGFGQITLPILGELEPWQFIFILVGTPGFVLSIIFFLLKEPKRIESSPREDARLADAFIFIFRKGYTFFTFVSIFMCMVAIAYGGFFNAPFLRGRGAGRQNSMQGIMAFHCLSSLR